MFSERRSETKLGKLGYIMGLWLAWQNLSTSRLILQLSLPNPLKPGV